MVDSLRMHLHRAKTKAKVKIVFDINHCRTLDFIRRRIRFHVRFRWV